MVWGLSGVVLVGASVSVTTEEGILVPAGGPVGSFCPANTMKARTLTATTALTAAANQPLSQKRCAVLSERGRQGQEAAAVSSGSSASAM